MREDIANEAGINKALLHYYFGSKDKLFMIIFDKQLSKFLDGMRSLIKSDLPLLEKIQQMVTYDIVQMMKEPIIPLFIFHELSRNPGLLQQKLTGKSANNLFEVFRQQVEDEISKGKIRAIDPKQLFVNLLALTVFPFIAKPMLQQLMTMNEKEFKNFINDRKQQVGHVLTLMLAP